MRCFIAIDSGGTKTDAVLFEETGHILARSLTQGCNAMDIGIGSACESLLGVLQNLVARIPGDGTLVSIYSGVAATDYFGGELGRYIRPYFPDVTMRFEDDAVNLISGTLGHQDGCCIISGTGSSLYARIGERIVHLGGWGYLIDTGGSGYAIGRDAILAVFRYCDGRAPYTRLYDLIQEQMGMPPEKNIPGIYEGGRPYIASFARTVFQARKEGDAAAEEIFQKAVHALAELTFAAERQFGGPYQGVLGGGIFAAFPEYAEELKAQASPMATLIRATVPPILGGVIEAMWGQAECSAKVRQRFLTEYKADAMQRVSE
ncbi:N-acetylglucosamine kinase [Pusillibacter faecalis]|uniref:Acyl-CoA reductase n=1 Tax=Pusillibacter faecalis TaxID=2714358 RepID=A0A810QB03_9FIRM|nr:BadF/BadG/BcrA/BcrD ATPase family protein [Pusillibacter faecalis]MCQ5027085.1 hypothetical protein [Oscillibacter valericigenes]BCK85450.1 acyl-CoA reductase [Pusillibacter faecalis]